MSDAIERFLSELRQSGSSRPSDQTLREIRDHLEDSTQRMRDSGVPEEQARERAVAAFGSPEDLASSLAKEECETTNGVLTRLQRRSGTIGIALVLPSIAFIVVNLLHFNLGVQGPVGAIAQESASWRIGSAAAAVRDVVVIGGPLLAFASFMLGAVHARVGREEGGLSAAISLRPTRAHLVTAVLSVLAMAILAIYVLTENNFPA